MSPLARENAELREQVHRWEEMARAYLLPLGERTSVTPIDLHNGLARLASLAIRHGVAHQDVLDAVQPDPRGATADSP